MICLRRKSLCEEGEHMGIKINREMVTSENAQVLMNLCPFGAIEYEKGELNVNSACKSCRICVKKGPAGVMTWQEEKVNVGLDKTQWSGVAVFAQCQNGQLHPVTGELIGKARELAAVIKEKVMAVIIGVNLENAVKELLSFGVDDVYVYEHPAFRAFTISAYSNAFYDFIQKEKPGSILVGATNLGRSLAPRVAARCRTGLTADCTVLKMKENTDLVQIRPAFGGNIMAQIVTPNARPQFCTVRYKVFSAPGIVDAPWGTVHSMEVTDEMVQGKTEILCQTERAKCADISEAEVIVACGRGLRKQEDMTMVEELAELLNAQVACTRPMVEAGWIDARKQIGLSGRTVKPKLIITLGISGSVQFAAGMNGSERIIAVNSDPEAAIFNIAHVGLVGDLYEIVPKLIQHIREEKKNV